MPVPVAALGPLAVGQWDEDVGVQAVTAIERAAGGKEVRGLADESDGELRCDEFRYAPATALQRTLR